MRPFFSALLSQAYGRVGRLDEAWRMLAEARAAVKESGRRYYEAETYRFKGELHLLEPKPDVERAEASFQRALDMARRQQAKSWELRAATSLARLWREQGGRAEARDLLAPIYGWFSEGFDTADLKEAKALLDELQ
jgi:predicted ATPase